MENTNPIICAIDTQNESRAHEIINQVKPYVGMIKIGLEYFVIHGAPGIKRINELNIPIFLDLKFHDIPNTVHGAVLSAAQNNIQMLTVHASGGSKMIEQAVFAANESSELWKTPKPLILGVTILTSLSEDDITQIGFHSKIKDQVMRLVDISVKSGVDGCVCSPHEVAIIREYYGKNDLKLIVPGIRLESLSKDDDQQRFMKPKEALEQGADFLVIGRPITKANNIAVAAKNIMENFI